MMLERHKEQPVYTRKETAHEIFSFIRFAYRIKTDEP